MSETMTQQIREQLRIASLIEEYAKNGGQGHE